MIALIHYTTAMQPYRLRRTVFVIISLLLASVPLASIPSGTLTLNDLLGTDIAGDYTDATLESITVKGRAAKTGYERSMFGSGWQNVGGCSTRELILRRDLTDISLVEECKIQQGVLNDPYTGKVIEFVRGPTTSDDVQIDHVVALSNAWQTGAQQLSFERRVKFANDPLNLLAVSGSANEQKSDGDAATWLPSNKSFRCQYVNRQVKVKVKYELWVTPAEKLAMNRVLGGC